MLSENKKFPLEPSVEEIERLIDETKAFMLEYFKDFFGQKADRTGEGLSLALDGLKTTRSMPEKPRSYHELLTELFSTVFPLSLQTAGPGYMAYIPGGDLFVSALADFIAKTLNRYVGVNFSAPLLSQLEADVLKWFAQLIGYPPAAKGIFTTGGSIANLTAVVIARTQKLGNRIGQGVIYTSEEAHHSIWKAALTAGILDRQQCKIPITPQHQIDPFALRQAIAADLGQGLIPFMVVGNAGTTDTGQIDPLKELAAIAREFNLWFHIDAAYGGFFTLTEKGKKNLQGIALADSITLDPHKGLFLPYGTGALLCKEGTVLKDTFSHKAAYITDTHENEGLWDFSEMSVELSREVRGLRIWLPFQFYGRGAFQTALEEKLELTEYLQNQLSQDSDCRLEISPPLSLIAFCYEPTRLPQHQWNEFNRQILGRVNQKNHVHLSGTTSLNKYLLRVCILSYRTHREQIDTLLQDLQASKEEAWLSYQRT